MKTHLTALWLCVCVVRARVCVSESVSVRTHVHHGAQWRRRFQPLPCFGLPDDCGTLVVAVCCVVRRGVRSSPHALCGTPTPFFSLPPSLPHRRRRSRPAGAATRLCASSAACRAGGASTRPSAARWGVGGGVGLGFRVSEQVRSQEGGWRGVRFRAQGFRASTRPSAARWAVGGGPCACAHVVVVHVPACDGVAAAVAAAPVR
jgi:hypothetical protein